MLARTYRFTAYNACGQTIASSGIVIKARRWKLDTSGGIVYESSETTVWTSGSTIANAAYLSLGSTGVDNSTDLFIGGDFTFTLVAPASASGDVTIYYEISTDGGTTFPTNGKGFLACTQSVTTSGTTVAHFQIQ